MTSHFSTGTRRRRSPPWCKPGMYTTVPPHVDAKPTTLNAFAAWRDFFGSDQFDLAESLHLRRTDAFDGWQARTFTTPYWLELQVHDTPDPHTFNLELYVKASWGTIHDHRWIHHQADPAARWDTQLLSRIWIPHVNYAHLIVLG
jgi:hypothetical protein